LFKSKTACPVVQDQAKKSNTNKLSLSNKVINNLNNQVFLGLLKGKLSVQKIFFSSVQAEVVFTSISKYSSLLSIIAL